MALVGVTALPVVVRAGVVRPSMVGTLTVHSVTVASVRAMVLQNRFQLRGFARRAAKHGRSHRTPQGEQEREKQQDEDAKRLHEAKVSRFAFPGHCRSRRQHRLDEHQASQFLLLRR
jgi:hypothetical protein